MGALVLTDSGSSYVSVEDREKKKWNSLIKYREPQKSNDGNHGKSKNVDFNSFLWGLLIIYILPTLNSAFIQEITQLKGTITGSQILSEPLKKKKEITVRTR